MESQRKNGIALGKIVKFWFEKFLSNIAKRFEWAKWRAVNVSLERIDNGRGETAENDVG